jgi:hypothetical protein
LEAQIDVDPIEQRTGEAARIPTDRLRRALAGAAGNAVLPARAGIGRDHELESRGIGRGDARAMQVNLAALERLAQGIEDGGGELSALVK